jgi:hypothetical protein
MAHAALHYADARAVSWGLGVAKASGDEMLTIVFEFVEGDFLGQTSRYFGKFTDDDKAAKTLEVMRTIGWTGNDFLDLGEAPKKLVRLAYELGEYNGEPQPNIRFVNAKDRMVADTLPADRRAAFASRMKGIALAANGGATAGKPAAKGKPAATGTKAAAKPAEDDIAF